MAFWSQWKVQLGVYLKHQVLFPGNIVEGYVEVIANAPIQFSAIRVKICGKEKILCRRQESRDTGRVDENGFPIRETYTQTYWESVPAYKHLLTLGGYMKRSGQTAPYFPMPPGRYTYPFAFQLPMNIPPSFAKRAGDDEADIMYYVKAYVDIPMGRDAVAKQFFTVLNAMPATQWLHRNGVTLDRYWDVTFCCCIDKGKVSARLFMDRTVISIDRDHLCVCADIDNSLGQEPVQSLEISLINNLEYRAQHVTERNRLVVGHIFLQNVQIPPGGKNRIQGVVPIPKDIVPTVHTHNIKSEYSIFLELNIPMASDPNHTFPVILSQCVDTTNVLPPVQFNQCPYPRYARGSPELTREDYYMPPQAPVFQCNMVPSCMPTGVTPHQLAINPMFNICPASGWAPPSAYSNIMQQKYAPPPTPLGQIQWTGGVQVQQMQVQAPPPPPSGLQPYGCTEPLGAGPASPMAGGNQQTPLLQQ